MTGRAEIECPTCVVLTVAGRGDELQDGVERLADGELASNDQGLAGDAAEAGNWQQFDASGRQRPASDATRTRRRE